jgi:NitT/TauT family transport system substrate-binding protein
MRPVRVLTRREALRTLGWSSLGLVAVSCAPSAEESRAPAAPAAPATTGVPAAQASRQVAKITIALPVRHLGFAPLFVAHSSHYFANEGIDADLQVLRGGPLTLAAVLSGEAQLHAWGPNDAFTAYENKLDFLTVAGLTGQFITSLAMRQDVLRQKGITAESPLENRVRALKGTRIGVQSPASPHSYALKYIVGQYGLDPTSDIELLPVGEGTNAALSQQLIDGVMGGVPTPQLAEREGLAIVMLRAADEIPAFRNWMSISLAGQREWIDSNSDVVERVCRALARACNLLLNDLSTSKQILKAVFSETDPSVVELGLDSLKSGYNPDARMTEQMWHNAADLFMFAGAMESAPPLAEGALWTNKYLTDVPKA